MTNDDPFEACGTCGKYGWRSSHRCPPMHEVWHEDSHGDLGEDSTMIYSFDCEEAAEAFMDQQDEYSEWANNGESITVKVRPVGTETWTEFEVQGEMVTNYRASEQ